MQPKVGYVKQSILKANGILDDAVRFVVEKQLKEFLMFWMYGLTLELQVGHHYIILRKMKNSIIGILMISYVKVMTKLVVGSIPN